MMATPADEPTVAPGRGAVPTADPDQPRAGTPDLPPFAARPVAIAAAALAVLLTATSAGYGFHRDELYFRMLPPAWGYIDQPPLIPWLARTFASVVDQPWFLRIPATLAAVASVVVLALVTREVGGGRVAQTLSAWTVTAGSFTLADGHVLLTSTVDLVVWPLVCLFALKAVRRDPRWWLATGGVLGLASYNRLLVSLLAAGLALGLAVLGPRRVFRSGWLWSGVAIAAILAAPNVAYQVLNNWPQLQMGAALGRHNGSQVRVLMWPYLLLLVGPVFAPVAVAGIVAPFRRPEWRDLRWVVVALPVVVLATFVGGAQVYYPLGIMAVLVAIGWAWIARRYQRVPRGWVVAIAANAAVSALIGLPLVPISVLPSTPIGAINQVSRDSIGWPVYTEQVANVVRDARAAGLDPVIVTGNYGEAGAIARYGPGDGIGSTVYSGQNSLGDNAPPASARDVVFVGWEPLGQLPAAFASCRIAATLDNGVGVDNEEQGRKIAVCSGRTVPWDQLWPRLKHLD
jgi:hypothetical protein